MDKSPYARFKPGDPLPGHKIEPTENAKAKLEPGGPLSLNGNFILYDDDGRLQHLDGSVQLCRCGKSKTKPYCDSSHEQEEFLDMGGMHEVSDEFGQHFRGVVRLKCQTDGPVQFDGTITFRNARGQVCTKRKGALCRCGHSSKKPFCDGSHRRVNFTSFVKKD